MQTPKLDGNHYYCLRITSQHPFCRSNKPAPFLSDPGLTRTVVPDFCNFTSVTVYMADLPFITQWVPFCTSHFQCGWLYVTVIGTAAFLFAFILAFICNYCCCKARRYLKELKGKKKRLELTFRPLEASTVFENYLKCRI